MKILQKLGKVAGAAREKVGEVAEDAAETAKNAVVSGAAATSNVATKTAKVARLGASRVAELAEDAGEVAGRVAKGAGEKALNAAETVKEGAQTAGTTMMRGGRVATRGVLTGAKGAASLAGKGGKAVVGVGAATWDAVDDKLFSVVNVIKETFVETVGDSMRAKVLDDKTMETLFGAVYTALPADIRRWVSPEQFTFFCFKNRDKIMDVQKSDAPLVLPPSNSVRRLDL